MFDLEECVTFITNSAAKKMADEFNERLMAIGITRVQWIALYFLGKYNEISQKNLAEKMNIKDPSVARLIDRMERDGLVKRVKGSKDRRVTNLELTDEGKKRRKELMPEGEKMRQVFSKGITDEEFAIFKKVLDKMLKNIL